MTSEEARNMLVAKMICLTRETSGTDKECNSHNCENCGLNYDQGNMGEQKEALEMAIKALEIVNDFEKAKIITGGRLNGRTHAYKCGLADGQRLAKGEKLFNILPLEAESEEKE